MKKQIGDFVAAGEVYFGEWKSIEDVDISSFLVSPETPETILLEKDKFRKLPRECEILVSILLDLPEEVFLLSGKVKKRPFRNAVKAKTGWDDFRIARVQDRLKTTLENY